MSDGGSWNEWTDLDVIRARLAAGADPNSGVRLFGKPLHVAAERGSPEVVAELAMRVNVSTPSIEAVPRSGWPSSKAV